MADAAEILGGPWCREITNVAQVLCFIFLMGAHVLTFSIMMNTLTNHGTCTIVFSVVGTILCFVLTLSRRLEEVSYLGIICMTELLSDVENQTNKY
jgi:hypothetical protein